MATDRTNELDEWPIAHPIGSEVAEVIVDGGTRASW
jgi:hypothetical protein